jgi:hypothetical protein
MGAALGLSGSPSFSVLSGQKAAWPDSIPLEGGLRSRGYELDDSGIPTFLYTTLQGADLSDQFTPGSGERQLNRNLSLTGGSGDGGKFYALLARGASIQALPNGNYLVNGRYYLEGDFSQSAPLLRQSAGQSELLVSLSDHPSFNYSLVW